MRMTNCIISGFFLLLVACQSGGSSVLEPVSEKVTEPTPQLTFDENASSAYIKLSQMLNVLGYQAVGLKYESDRTLEFLVKVFQNPDVAYRNIKSVYTGGAVAYDLKYQSLTIGGTQSPEKVIDFIKRYVPKKSTTTTAP